MDTHNASPQFKVGERVRVNAPHLPWHGRTGAYSHDSTNTPGFPCVVEFDAKSFACFKPTELTPAPPLGVAAWRLLFRAHRDGWELMLPVKVDGDYYRTWHNARTEQVFSLTTRKAAVR